MLVKSRDTVQQLITLTNDMQIVILSDREAMARQFHPRTRAQRRNSNRAMPFLKLKS